MLLCGVIWASPVDVARGFFSLSWKRPRHPLNNTPRDGVALAHSCQRWTWKWKRKYCVLTLRKKWDIEQNSLFSNISTFPAVLCVGRMLASCWGPLANYPRPKTNNYTPWSTQATWLPTLWCPVGGNKGVSLTQVFVYSLVMMEWCLMNIQYTKSCSVFSMLQCIQ